MLLVRPDWGACNLFQGGRIYGGSYNEAEAYLYFCRWAGLGEALQARIPYLCSVLEGCMRWASSRAEDEARKRNTALAPAPLPLRLAPSYILIY